MRFFLTFWGPGFAFPRRAWYSVYGVCGKAYLFTAASIKATRGKGADFYRQHLANNDYNSEDGRAEGIWRGSLASAFHLDGAIVQPEVFSLFQQNLHPESRLKLTPRNNPHAVRFYDFQCSAQKSVSVMPLFDSRLVEAHRKAVEIGMRELERFAAAGCLIRNCTRIM